MRRRMCRSNTIGRCSSFFIAQQCGYGKPIRGTTFAMATIKGEMVARSVASLLSCECRERIHTLHTLRQSGTTKRSVRSVPGKVSRSADQRIRCTIEAGPTTETKLRSRTHTQKMWRQMVNARPGDAVSVHTEKVHPVSRKRKESEQYGNVVSVMCGYAT